jgi:predicted cation transporter
VRLTMTDWPRRGTPFGIIEFTVFGKAVETPEY